MRKDTLISVLKNPDEFFLILRITGFLIRLPALIRFKSIQDVVGTITPKKTGAIRSPLTLDRVVYLCDRVLRIFMRHRFKYSCLKRCLLLYHFLRRYEVPVEINFGVKWMETGLTGHSWLTLDGEPYLEPPGKPDQFTRFFSLPGDPDGAESHSFKDVSFD